MNTRKKISMRQLLWAERLKLRRSKMIWIAVFATVMTALAVCAEGQFTFYGVRYIDNAGWYMTALQSLATFYVLPSVIALFGSYMICREEQEDVLKSLRMIPVSEGRLAAAKMAVSFVFGAAAYLFLFLLALAVEGMLHREALTAGMVLKYLCMYLLDGVGIFAAVSPLIALTAMMKRGYWIALLTAELYSFAGVLFSSSSIAKTVYPVLSAFQVSGYYEAALGERMGSLAVLLCCVALSGMLLKTLSGGN